MDVEGRVQSTYVTNRTSPPTGWRTIAVEHVMILAVGQAELQNGFQDIKGAVLCVCMSKWELCGRRGLFATTPNE